MGCVADHVSPERLGRFLRPWQAPAALPAPDLTLAAEARLDAMRKALAAADLTLRCTPAEDGRIGLTLTARGTVGLPAILRAELWPLTLGPNHSLTLKAELGRTGLHLGQFALADVTRWLGLRLTDLETGAELVFTLGTMSCCRFRGHEDKIVTHELESGYDETEVQPRVQDRGREAGDGSGCGRGAGRP